MDRILTTKNTYLLYIYVNLWNWSHYSIIRVHFIFRAQVLNALQALEALKLVKASRAEALLAFYF